MAAISVAAPRTSRRSPAASSRYEPSSSRTTRGSGRNGSRCSATAIGPEETAVVGDTTHDCAMGASAGAALVVGVLRGEIQG